MFLPATTSASVEEAVAILNGFVGVFPFEYVDGDSVVEIRQYLGEGQSIDDFDAVELCGEVAGGECVAGGVDENGDPCDPVDVVEECDDTGATATTADDCDEIGGITEDALPNTGGPMGMLVPLGALLVLLGAGLVMVRRPHSA